MQSHTQSQSAKPRIRGEIVDPSTAAALRAYLDRAGWRRTGVELRLSDSTMRNILASRPILHGSAVALRIGLADREPTP